MSTSQRPGGDALRQTILLIGFRGCGKTVVGRRLAKRLGWRHVDLDEYIERCAGCSIRTIFELHGEGYFRWREAKDVRILLHESPRPFIFSVGGGAIMNPESRDLLREAGRCVWLTASAEELDRRIGADPQSYERRPALTSLERRREIEELLAQREPLYADLAHVRVDTDGRTVEQVVDALHTALAGSPDVRPELRP